MILGGIPVTKISLGEYNVDERLDFSDKKYSIVINGIRINTVQSFDLKRSIQNFIGTFNVQFGNKRNLILPYVHIGDEVEFLRNGTDLVFRGRITALETSSPDGVTTTISISGKDVISDMLESSAEFITYKNKTDNFIIQKTIEKAGGNYQYNLGEPYTISEYDIGPGDTVESVIKGAAMSGGKFLWRRGDTLFKGIVSKEGEPVDRFFFGQLNQVNSAGNVERSVSDGYDWRTTQSIDGAKTKIIGKSTDATRGKSSLTLEKTVDVYKTDAYQRLIHNINPGSGTLINRPATVGLAGRNKGEMQREIDRMALESEPTAQIMFKVKGFRDYELNDVVHVQNLSESIDNNFAIVGLSYSLTDPTLESTELTLQPLGSYPK